MSGYIINPKDECYTPSYFIDPIRELWNGFHLDPFSCEEANKTVKADYFIDIEYDALGLEWLGICDHAYPTFWVNPPYSRGLIRHCIKKTLSYVGCAEIFLLVNSQTSSKAYQHCLSLCNGLIFPSKRIPFLNPFYEFKSQNDRDQTLFYFGAKRYKLPRLASLGQVIIPNRFVPKALLK